MIKPNYWQEKISLFLHDPIHKAFKIPGHENRAADICNLLHQTTASKEHYQVADMIASGLTRAALPGYSTDSQNGAIDLSEFPTVTHPLVEKSSLGFEVPAKMSVEKIHAELLELLKTDLGVDKDFEALCKIAESERPLNGYFNPKSNAEEWSKALYFYLFFAFKKRLRNQNVGGIGGLWDLLPADTRMPDHSIWHHCGLTSAIGSSMSSSGEISLAVFAITPVQPFIAKARKLRDSWTASVILSYLSFIGIRTIMNELGPDHIVYPSVQDQSLVEQWIGKEFHLERFLKENETLQKHNERGKSIASFPNKFVFLCGTTQVAEITAKIEQEIQAEWVRIADMVRDFLKEQSHSSQTMTNLFNHQISDYWQYSYASAKLAGLSDANDLSDILAKEKFNDEQQSISEFSKVYGDLGYKTAKLYGATHTLVQSLLASAKLKPTRIRKSQNGEKCPLCGEHEVLHDFTDAGKTDAKMYSDTVKSFWDRLRKLNSDGSTAQIGKNERICAICATKRFLPRVMKTKKEELLHEVLSIAEKFPSTTELATQNYIKKLTGKVSITREEYPKLVDALHSSELEGGTDDHSDAIQTIIAEGKAKGIKLTDRDKYYAVLLMDGDKMGDLVNGKTLTASWEDVIHPELKRRFSETSFNKNSALRKIGFNKQRIINPAVHSAISDSLNSFARYAVAPIVAQSGGRLIYAGGDDVCAVLPLDRALETAEKISQAYTMSFVQYGRDGAESVASANAQSGKMGIHLGKAEGISISGALIIAHHKEPLREVLRDAHAVLDGVAKKRAGRNALAIRLKKRSGGDRDIYFKWNAPNPFLPNETLLESFKKVMTSITYSETSSRLVYKMNQLEEAVRPLVKSLKEMELNRDKVVKLFAYEVGHSGLGIKGETKEEKDQRKIEMAGRLAGLCIQSPSSESSWFNAEGTIVGRFLAPEKDGEQ